MFLINDTFTLYFTCFYFQNLNKQKYFFTFIVLRSSSYSTKIALKWTKIMLQSSVISIWNPQNQGYKIGNIYNYWDQPWSPKNGLEMLLRILSANTVHHRTPKYWDFESFFSICEYQMSCLGLDTNFNQI